MLTIKLSEELDKRLSQIAKETNRTKSDCIVEAVETFLEDYEDYLIALAQADRLEKGLDKTISLEEMLRKLDLEKEDLR